jgi:hypothetical protein
MATVLEPRIDDDAAPGGSDQSFGLVFAGVFAVVACWPLLHWELPRWWALGLAGAFAAATLVCPQILHPLNQAWLAFGRLLHRVVSPLVMGLIFFFCVTPTGWIMRWRGRDLLSLNRRPDLKSYWIDREPSLPHAQSMKNQY